MGNRPKLDQVQMRQVVDRYKGGGRVAPLATEFNVSQKTILNILHRNAVSIRPDLVSQRAFNEEQEREILERYLSGESSPKLAKAYGVWPPTIRNVIKRQGHECRQGTDALRLLSVNESAFDEVTEESAYWIGFLMADGCVQRRSPSCAILTLGLSTKDADHLIKFRDFLKAEQKISYYSRDNVYPGGRVKRCDSIRLSVASNRLVTKLEGFGVCERKTFTARVKRLEYNRHFWRGVIDGDGSVVASDRILRGYSYRIPALHLSGSRQLVGQFINFVSQRVPSCRISHHVKGKIFGTSVTNAFALLMIEYLYKGATIALSRKKEIADSILEEFSDTLSRLHSRSGGRKYIIASPPKTEIIDALQL